MLIIHFLGLAMGLGTSFAFLFLGLASSKMDPNEGKKFMMNAFSISKMGHIGLALLLISGGYLMTPYWGTLGSSPLLIAKLSLFIVLGALIGVISASVRKVKNGDTSKMANVPILGRIALLVSMTIVILAVSFFR